MPRVHHRKARKDYPDNDIKAGQMYYTWSLKTGPRSSRTYRQLRRPQPWQLTSSPYKQQALKLAYQLETVDNIDDVESIRDEIEALRDEQESSRDNLPYSLQEGPTGELLQERYDACEQCIEELNDLISSGTDAANEVENAEEELAEAEDEEDPDQDHIDSLNNKIEEATETLSGIIEEIQSVEFDIN